MKFNDYSQIHRKQIQTEIKKACMKWQKDAMKKSPDIKTFSHILFDSNQGGKVMRGILVNVGYELHAGKKLSDIDKIAAAYEILQTALLIHDDVIDKSVLRRGKKTVFQQLGGNHYGISQAICLGDIGFFLATQMISETNFPDPLKSKVLSLFSQIVLDTVVGQMLDIKFSNKKNAVTEKKILTIAKLKTAHYTITGPLLLGAMLAGANTKVLDALKIFGDNLGIAYQIQDDILGVFGEEKVIGKSVTSDIEEGKNTLLFSYALANASPKEKFLLLHTYGKGKITHNQYETVKSLFQTTGALEYAEKQSEIFRKKSALVINSITKNEQQRMLLHDFITVLTNRKK